MNKLLAKLYKPYNILRYKLEKILDKIEGPLSRAYYTIEAEKYKKEIKNGKT